jgi:hypothetical protein
MTRAATRAIPRAKILARREAKSKTAGMAPAVAYSLDLGWLAVLSGLPRRLTRRR